MKIPGKIFLFLSCAVFFAVPVFAFAQTPATLAPANYDFEKIFYLASYNASSGIASLNKNWDKIDILAPQMYALKSNLTVSGGFGPKLKKAIKDHNIKVMPLIANANFSQKTIHNFLASQDAQNKVINVLVQIAKSQGYIGWQIDFENINYQDKDLFTAFVQKAYPLFQKNKLVFSVAAIPRITDYEDTNAFKNWGGAYDYKKISDSCDFISVMAYDDNNSSGPVASVIFVNKVLDYVKDKIPPQKLSLGVPTYYWRWSLADNKKVGVGAYKNLLDIMANFRYETGFDSNLGVPWITYFFKNKQYAIWFENKQSLVAKLDIVKSDNLRGFSAWLLGAEDPAIWSILGKSH